MLTRSIRYFVLAALFLIPFIPLYVSTSLYFPFITGKHFAFRIIVEVALVAWGILMLLDARYRPRFSITFVLYGALVLWMFVADLFAINSHKAFWSNYERMDGWVTLAHVFGFFLIAGSVLTIDKLWKRWWLTFVGASVFVWLYGFLQLLGLFTINQGGVRVDATLGNAAYLAAYLLFVIAVSTWQALESRGVLRWALFTVAALQSLMLFYTATRGALLGFAGAVVLGSVLYLFHTSGKARRVGVAVLVFIAIVAGGFFLVRDQAWVKAEPTLARLSSITLADGQTRFALWGMAAQGVMERPITGWGHEGFNYLFNKGYTPSLYAQEPWFDRAHNVFIDWLVAGGVPAFLLFVALLISAATSLYRHGNKHEKVVLLSLLAAYSFQGLFVFDNLFSYVPLAAVLAYAHALSGRPITKLESLPRVDDVQAASMALPVGAVVAIVLVWSVNVPSMQAANDLIQGLSPMYDARTNLAGFERALGRNGFAHQEIREQLVSQAATIVNRPNVPEDVKLAFARAALSEIGKEVERAPRDARLRLQYAYAYRTLGDYTNAKRELSIAQSLSPKKQSLIVEEGVLALQAKDYPAARAAFKRAFELDTSFPDLAAYAAAGEVLIDNQAAADTLLVQYFGTTTVPNGILILAYYEVKEYDRLFPLLEERVRYSAGDPTAVFQLATIYAESGRVEDARDLVRGYIKAYPAYTEQGMQFITSIDQITR